MRIVRKSANEFSLIVARLTPRVIIETRERGGGQLGHEMKSRARGGEGGRSRRFGFEGEGGRFALLSVKSTN